MKTKINKKNKNKHSKKNKNNKYKNKNKNYKFGGSVSENAANSVNNIIQKLDSIVKYFHGIPWYHPKIRPFLLGTSNNGSILSNLPKNHLQPIANKIRNTDNITNINSDQTSIDMYDKIVELDLENVLKNANFNDKEKIINLLRELPINIYLTLLEDAILSLNYDVDFVNYHILEPEPYNNIILNFDGINLDLNYKNIKYLPEIFSALEIQESLHLQSCGIISLPTSFGLIKIGEDLRLENNRLTKLPKSFEHIGVLRDIILKDNNLEELEDYFKDIQINGDLFLNNNRLTNLPNDFNLIRIGGDLNLTYNLLDSQELTELNFPNVDGNLNISPQKTTNN